MDRQRPVSGHFLGTGFIILFTLLFAWELSAAPSGSKGPAKGLQLIMFEQEGCHYCEVWDANVGVVYDKTPEGRYAPLKKVDIHTDDDVPNVKPVIYTPTFVLYKDGQEVGRLTGYISDDFFWGLLNPLLKKHGFDNNIRESKVQNKPGKLR